MEKTKQNFRELKTRSMFFRTKCYIIKDEVKPTTKQNKKVIFEWKSRLVG